MKKLIIYYRTKKVEVEDIYTDKENLVVKIIEDNIMWDKIEYIDEESNYTDTICNNSSLLPNAKEIYGLLRILCLNHLMSKLGIGELESFFWEDKKSKYAKFILCNMAIKDVKNMLKEIITNADKIKNDIENNLKNMIERNEKKESVQYHKLKLIFFIFSIIIMNIERTDNFNEKFFVSNIKELIPKRGDLYNTLIYYAKLCFMLFLGVIVAIDDGRSGDNKYIDEMNNNFEKLLR